MGFYGTLFRGASQAAAGASMATGNMVFGAVQNARTKREIRAAVKQAGEANFQNRAVAVLPGINKQLLALVSNDPQDNDVYDYDTQSATPALDFIWGQDDAPEGVVVSGGGNDERVRALMAFVDKAQSQDRPLIVLHTGNGQLAGMLDAQSRACEHISRTESYYDVFRGMPMDDMAYLLYETFRPGGAKPAAESLLRAALGVLLLSDGAVAIEKLATLALQNLDDQLAGFLKTSAISQADYDELHRYYLSGSAEIDAVRIQLSRLARQVEGVYGRMGSRSCNIKRMLNAKGVVAIDVGLANNDLLVGLVVNHLLLLESQGRDFAIILDNIPVSRFPQIMDVLRSRRYAISHDDVVSSLFGGDRPGDDLFSEITGNVKTVVLFRQASGSTCQKWSDYLGKYHKIRIRFNISQNNAFLNNSNSHGISVDETDEPRVRAETLSRLPPNAVCVYRPEGILIAAV